MAFAQLLSIVLVANLGYIYINMHYASKAGGLNKLI